MAVPITRQEMERVAQCQEQETTSDNLIGKVNITIEMIGRLMAHVSDHIPTMMTMTQDQFAQTQHQVNAQAAQMTQMQNHLNTRATQTTQAREHIVTVKATLERIEQRPSTQRHSGILDSKAVANLSNIVNKTEYRTWNEKLVNAVAQARPRAREAMNYVKHMVEQGESDIEEQ